MINIRNAEVTEHEILSEIAFKAEAYLGYDDDYMNKFKAIYKVSEKFIRENLTVVMEDDRKIVGFYGLINSETETSLEYFFIEPDYIGRGFGRILWSYLEKDCKEHCINKLSIVTSPQSKNFYVKMGAVICGEVESLLRRGRKIPQLIWFCKN